MRVVIFGTSNGLIFDGYPSAINSQDDYCDIHNMSLGASPSLVLAYRMSQVDLSSYELAILETSVNDAACIRAGAYHLDTMQIAIQSAISDLNRHGVRSIGLILPGRTQDAYASAVYDVQRQLFDENKVPYIDGSFLVQLVAHETGRQWNDFFRDDAHCKPRIIRTLVHQFLDSIIIDSPIFWTAALSSVTFHPLCAVSRTPNGNPINQPTRLVKTSILEETLYCLDSETILKVSVPAKNSIAGVVTSISGTSCYLEYEGEISGAKDFRFSTDADKPKVIVCSFFRPIKPADGYVTFRISIDQPDRLVEPPFPLHRHAESQGIAEFAGFLFIDTTGTAATNAFTDTRKNIGMAWEPSQEHIRTITKNISQLLNEPPSMEGAYFNSISNDTMIKYQNLAIHKPATQSSTSKWSSGNEAENAVNGKKTGGFSFHTDIEDNPWWQVDLGAVEPLSFILIYNRGVSLSEIARRAASLSIFVSTEGFKWTEIFTNDRSFGGVLDNDPLRVNCPSGTNARFVRLRLRDRNYLHLDEVEIYVPIDTRFIDPLTVYQAPSSKIRLGKSSDGGYVICGDIGDYDLLLSGGINYDTSFEFDFLERHPVNCLAFDHTISNLPKNHPRIKWKKKAIGCNLTNDETNLTDIISSYRNVFVKMDIEGSEYSWIDAFSYHDLLRIKQLAIEFHNPYTDYRMAMLRKLNRTHAIVHLHANNCCGVQSIAGINVPVVFECTLIRRDDWPQKLPPNPFPIPSQLDFPNVANQPDIELSGWPFTGPA
jgi:hypothetical protein